jgi:hypothetical protein
VAIDSTYSEPRPIADAGGGAFAKTLNSEPWLAFPPDDDEQGLHEVTGAERYLDQNRPPTYQISYHDGEKQTDIHLPYRLPDGWLFVGSVPEYEWIRRERRAERAASQSIDARAVLFGPQLSEFIAREILTAPNLAAAELYAEIHARWLGSPRADLRGESPREILLAKKDFVDFDLHSRELQWSFTGECPPPLPASSHAFRFAGFGTHEIVLYYDLIRILLNECCNRARAITQVSLADEIERLENIKDAWLEMPQDDCRGKAPALVIDCERKRIPLAMSGKEAMIDEDCPVCQAMAEGFDSPFFWHLDGCNLDDWFEFSYFKTRAEWVAERCREEAFHREMAQKWNEHEAGMHNNGAMLVAHEGEPA